MESSGNNKEGDKPKIQPPPELPKMPNFVHMGKENQPCCCPLTAAGDANLIAGAEKHPGMAGKDHKGFMEGCFDFITGTEKHRGTAGKNHKGFIEGCLAALCCCWLCETCECE